MDDPIQLTLELVAVVLAVAFCIEVWPPAAYLIVAAAAGRAAHLRSQGRN